jgi:hypothetical protein
MPQELVRLQISCTGWIINDDDDDDDEIGGLRRSSGTHSRYMPWAASFFSHLVPVRPQHNTVASCPYIGFYVSCGLSDQGPWHSYSDSRDTEEATSVDLMPPFGG